MSRGLFITFEGPEGSGKSTQIRRLTERLDREKIRVVTTREPGGTATGEMIRTVLQHDASGEPIDPAAETLLFAASRAQLVGRVIRPALERGDWVLCDRFADSTTVYQGYGRGFDVERILEINAFAIGDAVPDLTFLLDMEVALGMERIQRRHVLSGAVADRFEREHLSFHERVRQGYLKLAARWPDRFRVLDAGQDADQVAENVWRELGLFRQRKNRGTESR